jgi:hypothetical protein
MNGTRTKLAGISGSRIFETVVNRGFTIPQSDQETSSIETEVRQLFSHQICPNILQVWSVPAGILETPATPIIGLPTESSDFQWKIPINCVYNAFQEVRGRSWYCVEQGKRREVPGWVEVFLSISLGYLIPKSGRRDGSFPRVLPFNKWMRGARLDLGFASYKPWQQLRHAITSAIPQSAGNTWVSLAIGSEVSYNLWVCDRPNLFNIIANGDGHQNVNVVRVDTNQVIHRDSIGVVYIDSEFLYIANSSSTQTRQGYGLVFPRYSTKWGIRFCNGRDFRWWKTN